MQEPHLIPIAIRALEDPLPTGWAEARDPGTGAVVYRRLDTSEVCPRPAPASGGSGGGGGGGGGGHVADDAAITNSTAAIAARACAVYARSSPRAAGPGRPSGPRGSMRGPSFHASYRLPSPRR